MLLAMISAVDSQGRVVDFAAEARAMSARGGNCRCDVLGMSLIIRQALHLCGFIAECPL